MDVLWKACAKLEETAGAALGKVGKAAGAATVPLAAKIAQATPEPVRRAVGLLEFDSPVVVSLVICCTLIHTVTTLLYSGFTKAFFTLQPFGLANMLSPLTWWRLVSHGLGHGSWQHLSGNVSLILLVGPPCEKELGGVQLVRILLWTALASAVCHILLGPTGHGLLGASGIAFALILLNSLSNVHAGRIPVSFVLTAAIWLTSEVTGFVRNHIGEGDGVSHLAHLVGALVGAVCGFLVHHPEKKLGLWQRFTTRLGGSKGR